MSPQELIKHENVRNVIQQATEHLEETIAAKEQEVAAVKEVRDDN